MFYPQTLVDWITIFSGIATVILVLVIFFQAINTREMVILTKEEMENRLRPWVGRKYLTINGSSKDRDGNPAIECIFVFQNYGGIPAINSRIKIMYGKEPLKLAELQ